MSADPRFDQLLSSGIRATPASFVRAILQAASDPGVISFAGGLPNPATFPQDELLAGMERVVREHGATAFQYSTTAGIPELRAAIAARLTQRHGIPVDPEHIIVTTGSQQALDLLGKVFLDPGDPVVVEKPTYLAAIQAFSLQRPRFVAVDLGPDGIDLAALEAALEAQPKFVYLVPNFQNPTGLTYSAANRAGVRELLDGRACVLVEDDPYGELRFRGEDLPPIGLGYLPGAVLLGSFSKVVTPGMRLGYLVCPDDGLRARLRVAKEAADLHTNVFAQLLLADYLRECDLDAHIASIRELYGTQARAMVGAIGRHFPAGVHVTDPDGGMFCWATLPHGRSARELFPRALERKVAFVPGDPFYVDVCDAPTLRLNFTNADEATIEEGVRRLGELLREG